MGSPDLAIWRICLQHNPVQGYSFKGIDVFLRFQTASVDPDEQIQLYYFFDFLRSTSKRMYYSRAEPLPVLLDDIEKVIPCVPVVQVHG